MYPAGYPEVNSVTAGDSPTSIAPYANISPSNDAMAPGAARIQFNGQSYIIQGTSPAAANFSGLVAALIANGQTPPQAQDSAKKVFALPAR
jgi:hypothetical protein